MDTKQLRVISGSLLLSGGLLAACAGAPGGAASPGKNALLAIKVDATSMDSAASYWANAPKLDVQTKAVEEGKPDGPLMTLQAAYDAKTVAFRLEWADSTGNVTRGDYTFDGSKFTRDTVQDDRMMMMFPMTNDAKFATKGCGAACHNEGQDPKKWYMATESDDAPNDLWEWTSARSNSIGTLDDRYFAKLKDPANVESGLIPDKEGTPGGSVNNQNKAKDGPAFVNGKNPASKYIVKGEEAPIDLTKLKAGDIVPGFILAKYNDSRGDVSVKGTWANGKWVVVIQRALNTGNSDDVVFTPSKALPFGIGVTDRTDLYHHTVSPDPLTLQWQ